MKTESEIKERIKELEELKRDSYTKQVVLNVGVRKFSNSNTVIYTKIINELKSIIE